MNEHTWHVVLLENAVGLDQDRNNCLDALVLERQHHLAKAFYSNRGHENLKTKKVCVTSNISNRIFSEKKLSVVISFNYRLYKLIKTNIIKKL